MGQAGSPKAAGGEPPANIAAAGRRKSLRTHKKPPSTFGGFESLKKVVHGLATGTLDLQVGQADFEAGHEVLCFRLDAPRAVEDPEEFSATLAPQLRFPLTCLSACS